VYRNILRKYGLETGISAEVNGLCVHSLRATAATNALSHEADIAKVQEWLGHANVPRRGFTTGAKRGPRTAPRSGFSIRVFGMALTRWRSGIVRAVVSGFGRTQSIAAPNEAEFQSALP